MIPKILVAVAAFALHPTAACAQEVDGGDLAAQAPKPLAGKKLVVYIKSDETRQVGLGLFTARMAARAGAKVTVILGADGTEFALKAGKQEKFIATDETPREMIAKLAEVGGTVYVCKLCSTTRGYESDEFIGDAEIVTMKEIFATLFEDDARSLEF